MLETAKTLDDVSCLYLVLEPDQPSDSERILYVPEKKLPIQG